MNEAQQRVTDAVSRVSELNKQARAILASLASDEEREATRAIIEQEVAIDEHEFRINDILDNLGDDDDAAEESPENPTPTAPDTEQPETAPEVPAEAPAPELEPA